MLKFILPGIGEWLVLQFIANWCKKDMIISCCSTSSELDLRDQAAVRAFFETEQPEYIFLAAAKVGGIMANNIYRAEFLNDNLLIQNNVIDSAYRTQCQKTDVSGIKLHLSQSWHRSLCRKIRC